MRLYLSTGQSGDGTLMWDAVAYEGESDAELVKKFQLLSVEEVGKLLLQSVKLQEYDQVSLRNGSVQDAKQMILRQKCGECGKEREGNSACGGCGVVMYCGRDVRKRIFFVLPFLNSCFVSVRSNNGHLTSWCAKS